MRIGMHLVMSQPVVDYDKPIRIQKMKCLIIFLVRIILIRLITGFRFLSAVRRAVSEDRIRNGLAGTRGGATIKDSGRS